MGERISNNYSLLRRNVAEGSTRDGTERFTKALSLVGVGVDVAGARVEHMLLGHLFCFSGFRSTYILAAEAVTERETAEETSPGPTAEMLA